MSLRDKYQNAVQTAKGLHMDGSAQEKDGKLHFSEVSERAGPLTAPPPPCGACPVSFRSSGGTSR